MKSAWIFLLVAALLISFGSVAGAEERIMVDSLVATVENETISIEDVYVETEILARTKIWFSLTEVPENPTEKLAFQEIITRKLLYMQARKMGFAEVPPERVEAAMAEFRATFSSPKAYHDWLMEHDLRDPGVKQTHKDLEHFRLITKRFYRRLVIANYLEKKIAVQVKLGRNAYLEKNEAKLRAAAPGATEEQLIEMACKALYNEKLQEHIAELRERSNVVIIRGRFL
ncbi:MAG: hypothetical protein P9L99_18920 [Candidatus Lernaella stagnicola]|nr:hypothetical protein [Candidatus Lernaella stagnicola]